MTLILTILGMGIITYAIRLSFIVMGDRLQLTAVSHRALKYVPTAVLSAIILPEILQPNGALDLSLDNPRLLSGLVAALIAWRTGNILWTIGAGMALLWGWQYIF